MKLPKNERKRITQPKKNVMLLHGQPLSGKTSFADELPDHLFITTDYNVGAFSSPHVSIDDSWIDFVNVIELLESEDHEFRSVTLDLVEDLYCIALDYFGSVDVSNVRFAEMIERVTKLDIDNLVLLTRTKYVNGLIRTNLNEVTHHNLSSMVDLIGQVSIDDGVRHIDFTPSNEHIRGSRYELSRQRIPMSVSSFLNVYQSDNIELDHSNDAPDDLEDERTQIVEPVIETQPESEMEPVHDVSPELEPEVIEVIDIEVKSYVDDEVENEPVGVDIDFSQFFEHMDVSDVKGNVTPESVEIEPTIEDDDEVAEYAEYEEIEEIEEIEVVEESSGGIEIDFSLFDQDLVDKYKDRKPVKEFKTNDATTEIKTEKKKRTRKSR